MPKVHAHLTVPGKDTGSCLLLHLQVQLCSPSSPAQVGTSHLYLLRVSTEAVLSPALGFSGLLPLTKPHTALHALTASLTPNPRVCLGLPLVPELSPRT